jgi:L-seryl-tRNA(Ser) seleniumtransferase
VWQALLATPEKLRPRTAAVAAMVGASARQVDGMSMAGGGSLPGEDLPSVLVTVDPGPVGVESVLASLRAHDPPVIARADRGSVLLDLRTVPPEDDGTVAEALRQALLASG